MSIEHIGNRHHEFSKATHFIVIARDYFIATVSLYGTTLVYSFLKNSIQVLMPTSIAHPPGLHRPYHGPTWRIQESKSHLSTKEERTRVIQGKARLDLKSLIAAETTGKVQRGVGVVRCGPVRV